MEKLKVGDKVVLIRSHWGVSYTFSEVERLTNTTAVLKSGAILKNEVTRYGFKQIGERDYYWKLSTHEITAKHELQQHEQKISNWFSQQKFNTQQKEQIYNLFNEQR
jgi:hypothetical protein